MSLRPLFRRGPAAAACAAVLLVALAATPARSQTWNEAGDAGPLVSTAQVTTGNGNLTTINGTLSGTSDVDMYCIHVDDWTIFQAYFLCASMTEPHIYLFAPSSLGIAHDDGCQASFSGVKNPYPGNNGMYYLAVANPGALALNGASAIWTYNAGNPIVGQRAPDGPAAGLPLTGWAPGNTPAFNAYTVHLAGASFCAQGTTPARRTGWGEIRAMYR